MCKGQDTKDSRIDFGESKKGVWLEPRKGQIMKVPSAISRRLDFMLRFKTILKGFK